MVEQNRGRLGYLSARIVAEQEVSLTTIYIYLNDEGTDVWRPVTARHLEADIFEIITENSNPLTEHWEFNQGQKVRCRERISSEGEKILIAYDVSPQ